MAHPSGIALAAIGVFVGTNLDDLIVLAVLFASSRVTGVPKRWSVWAGQFGGIGALVAVSASAALSLVVVPDPWPGLLGLIPICLGIRTLIWRIRPHNQVDEPGVAASGAFAVAGLTIANGADNIAVYTPMLRTIGLTESLTTIAVFGVMTAVWCAAGSWLSSYRTVTAIIDRYGHWIVPGVFLIIGTVVVAESGVIHRLLGGMWGTR